MNWRSGRNRSKTRPLHHGATEARRKTKAKTNGFLVCFHARGFHRAEEITEKRMSLFRVLRCPMNPTPLKVYGNPLFFCRCFSPCLRGSVVQRFFHSYRRHSIGSRLAARLAG